MLTTCVNIGVLASDTLNITYVASDGNIKSFELYHASENIQSFTTTWVDYFETPTNIGSVTLAEGADGKDGSAYVVFKAKEGYKFSGFSADGIFASTRDTAKLTAVAYESWTSKDVTSEAHTLTQAKKFLDYSNSWSNCYNYRYDLFPENAKYIKVVLPQGNSSMVFANNFRFTMIPETASLYGEVFTDDFDGESIYEDCNIYSEKYSGFYTSASPKFGDGHVLAVKTSYNVEYDDNSVVTFKAPPGFKYKTFTVTAYAQGPNARKKTLSFEAGSAADGSFLKIPATVTYSAEGWTKCVYDFASLPANTKYIKLTFPRNMVSVLSVDKLEYTIADDEAVIDEMPYERYAGMNLTEPERPMGGASGAEFVNTMSEYGVEQSFTMDITQSTLEGRRILAHSGLDTFNIMTAWQLSSTAPDIKVLCSSAYKSTASTDGYLAHAYWVKTGGIPADSALTGFDVWLRTPDSFKIYASDSLDGEYTELAAASTVKDIGTYKDEYFWSESENKVKEYYRTHYKVHYDIPAEKGYRYIKIQCLPSETSNDYANHFLGIWNYSYKKVKAYADSDYLYNDYENKAVVMAPQGKKISLLEYTTRDGSEGKAYFSKSYADGFKKAETYNTAVTFRADDTKGTDAAWNILSSSKGTANYGFANWMNAKDKGGDGAYCLGSGKVSGVETTDYWVVTGGIPDGTEMKSFEVRARDKQYVKVLGSAALDGEYTEVALTSERTDTGNESTNAYAPQKILSYDMEGLGYKYVKIQSLAENWGGAILGQYSYTYDKVDGGESTEYKVYASEGAHYAYVGAAVADSIKVTFVPDDEACTSSAVVVGSNLADYTTDTYIVDFSGLTVSTADHNAYGGTVTAEYSGAVTFDDASSYMTLGAPNNSLITSAELVATKGTELSFAYAESLGGRYTPINAVSDETTLGTKYVKYTVDVVNAPYLRISGSADGTLVSYSFNWQGEAKSDEQGYAHYSVNVDYDDVRQELKAWGFFPGSTGNIDVMNEYDITLFEELNADMLRFELYADVDDEGNTDTSYLDKLITLINIAKEHDLEYMITIWSPPASMKTNGMVWGINDDGTSAYLVEGREDDFVKVISDCLLYIREQTGTLPVGFSVANEPPNTTTYQSCAYTVDQLRSVLVKLSARFDADGLGDVMILSPETNTLKGVGRYLEYDWSWLNTEDGQAVDAVIYHVYDDATNNHPNDMLGEALSNLSKSKPRETWQTEFCPAGLTMSKHRFANEILRKINHDTQHMGVSRWVYWYGIINAEDDESLINVVDGKADVKKEYFLLRALYNSAPGGSMVVNADINDPRAADELEACYTQSDVGAYDTDNGTVVTLANTSDFSKTYALSGLKGTRAMAYIFRGASESVDHVFFDVEDGTLDGLTLDAYDCAVVTTSDSVITDAYADLTSGDIKLTVDSQKLKGYSNPMLIKAVYDGKVMETAEKIALNAGDEYTISMSEYSAGKTVKLFLWNMENLYPIYTKTVN